MISVVMPVLDEERLVGRALRSVLEQTFADFELIVVDNGSTDRTKEIVAEVAARDARVRLIEEPEPGTYVARNRGLSEARRPWVAVQDADDVSHPERFARQIAELARRPRTVVLGSWAVVYSERTGLRDPHYHATGDLTIRSQLRLGPAPFVHSSVIASRAACLRVGGYPARYPSAEDYALWGLLRTEGRLANLPMHLVLYRHQEREPGSEFRARERRLTEELKRRLIGPPRFWDERLVEWGARRRRSEAFARVALDWPQGLLERYGLGWLAAPGTVGAGA